MQREPIHEYHAATLCAAPEPNHLTLGDPDDGRRGSALNATAALGRGIALTIGHWLFTNQGRAQRELRARCFLSSRRSLLSAPQKSPGISACKREMMLATTRSSNIVHRAIAPSANPFSNRTMISCVT